MASAHGLALGPFLFWADRLELKGDVFAVVLRKPRFRDILIGKYLDVIRVATQTKRGIARSSCKPWLSFALGETSGSGAASSA
jgi:hypothetical protein